MKILPATFSLHMQSYVAAMNMPYFLDSQTQPSPHEDCSFIPGCSVANLLLLLYIMSYDCNHH